MRQKLRNSYMVPCIQTIVHWLHKFGRLYIQVVGLLFGRLSRWGIGMSKWSKLYLGKGKQLNILGHIWDIYWAYLGHIWEISETYLGHIWNISGHIHYISENWKLKSQQNQISPKLKCHQSWNLTQTEMSS